MEVLVSENGEKADVSADVSVEKAKKPRGFAAMSKERQKEIASLGGRIAHKKGKAHQFDSESARAAGKTGGEASQKKRHEEG